MYCIEINDRAREIKIVSRNLNITKTIYVISHPDSCTPLLTVIVMKLPRTLLINLLVQSKCMLIGITILINIPHWWLDICLVALSLCQVYRNCMHEFFSL